MRLEKLNRDLLNKCYYDTVITQYKKELENNGFIVSTEHLFSNKYVDLFAEKDTEKRVYEFKMVGNRNQPKDKIIRFKDFVVSNGATPYVVYVNPPEEKQIQFDGLDELLTKHFTAMEIPSELDSLSTRTSIASVEVSDLTSVEVSENTINIDGIATISVNLQYGSNFDSKKDNDIVNNDSFPMSFSVKLNNDNKKYSIEDIEYSIDTSSWND